MSLTLTTKPSFGATATTTDVQATSEYVYYACWKTYSIHDCLLIDNNIIEVSIHLRKSITLLSSHQMSSTVQ